MAKRKGIVDAAVNAAEELGQAAVAFKESWKHVKNAQEKGKSATRAVKNVAKGATRAARRLLPGQKTRKRS